MKTFRRMGVDPLGYQDKVVRVRGIVQWLNGPEIEAGNPNRSSCCNELPDLRQETPSKEKWRLIAGGLFFMVWQLQRPGWTVIFLLFLRWSACLSPAT